VLILKVISLTVRTFRVTGGALWTQSVSYPLLHQHVISWELASLQLLFLHEF